MKCKPSYAVVRVSLCCCFDHLNVGRQDFGITSMYLWLLLFFNSLYSSGINQVFFIFIYMKQQSHISILLLFSVNIKCYRTKASILMHKNENAVERKKKQWTKSVGKDHFICAYIAVQSITLMLNWAQWNGIYVPHLMSIFRKSDIVSHFILIRQPTNSCINANENVWRATKMHFMQWQNNIIAFCLFVDLMA